MLTRVRRKDRRLGRLIYVRDPNYVPALARDTPVSLAVAHARVVMPAMSAQTEQMESWSEPIAAPPLRVLRPQRAAAGSRGHVALVFMPGVSTYPAYTRFSEGKAEGQLAIELRGSQGGGRLRLAGEYTSFGKIGELSVKYDLLDGFFLRPFLAVGVGVASINPDPSPRAAGSGSAGIDLYLGRDFFLTGELKRRFFMQGTQGEAHGLVIAPEKQTSLLVGMGFYLF
jgi:hypothetical protein